MEWFPAPLSRVESDAMVDQSQGLLAARGWGFWALETRSERKCIGFVGLNATAPELPFSPSIEISWRLAAPHWGKGYASEEGRGALRVGFARLRFDDIVAFTAVGNLRSRAVMERIGMHDTEKPFEHPKVPVGSVLRTHCVYRVTRKQWEANNSS